MGLFRSLFWFAIFLASTFTFTVLFEHGPTNFSDNAQKELDNLSKYYSVKVEKKQDSSDKLGR